MILSFPERWRNNYDHDIINWDREVRHLIPGAVPAEPLATPTGLYDPRELQLPNPFAVVSKPLKLRMGSKTLAKLKDSLRPIAWTEAEYNEVVRKVDEFGASAGPELQKRLVQRAQEREHWLEEWWDDLGYLGYRDSVSSPRLAQPFCMLNAGTGCG